MFVLVERDIHLKMSVQLHRISMGHERLNVHGQRAGSACGGSGGQIDGRRLRPLSAAHHQIF